VWLHSGLRPCSSRYWTCLVSSPLHCNTRSSSNKTGLESPRIPWILFYLRGWSSNSWSFLIYLHQTIPLSDHDCSISWKSKQLSYLWKWKSSNVGFTVFSMRDGSSSDPLQNSSWYVSSDVNSMDSKGHLLGSSGLMCVCSNCPRMLNRHLNSTSNLLIMQYQLYKLYRNSLTGCI